MNIPEMICPNCESDNCTQQNIWNEDNPWFQLWYCRDCDIYFDDDDSFRTDYERVDNDEPF